ncbi:uncharacterized protein [Rutidosis leptorrhynchoides]|uniref:uncharacterized protein n=1 Tax=Rutidosis leptorrhynchoides TaxID=125765 RepID=UPI003A99A4D2
MFSDRLKNVKRALRDWSSKKFKTLDDEIEAYKREAMEWELKAESTNLMEQDRDRWLECRRHWVEKENIKSNTLKQKARLKWALEGNENSKFFHAAIRRKNSKSNFSGVNINGTWCEDPMVVKEAVFGHFQKIYSANKSVRPSFRSFFAVTSVSWAGLNKNIDQVFGPIGPGVSSPATGSMSKNDLPDSLAFHVGGPPATAVFGPNLHANEAFSDCFRLTQEEANNLELQFDEEEIWDALKNCASNKAPGPDDFNMSCNSSFITLVPKIANPVSLNEYRPISLIGSFYKIIAKILFNRIKKVVPNLISFEQSAFIKGRNIIDGVLVANESIEFLKNKHLKSMVFKVGFEKAFDSINWEFLDEMMVLMGVGAKWRKWIASCLNSASISVLVNGSPTKEFKLGKGVRQGDPLSPFLFIIVAEGLNWLAKSAVSKNLFEGIEIGHDKVRISHLQYADDTIFLGKWSFENIENLMKLLKCYEFSSGLKVNYGKSNLFRVCVDKNEVDLMASLFGCKTGSFPMTYLGLPIGANMKKLVNWKPVIEKFEKRLSDWKARTISFGGRLTLVNAVLNSLPLYFFLALPCPALRAQKTRVSLIGKWWWRFLTETTSLWVKVIKNIYGDSRLLFSGGNNVSNNSLWSNIVKAGFEINNMGVEFTSSFERKIGNGCKTRFWEDVWLKDKPLKEIFKRLVRLESNPLALVSNRLLYDLGPGSTIACWEWSRSLAGRTKDELDELMGLVTAITINPEKEDTFSWKLSGNGLFSTKKLTKLIMSRTYGTNGATSATMKNNYVPKKMEVFVWRARKERLPVLSELDKRGVDVHSTLCPLCGNEIESVNHALLSCEHVRIIWKKVREWWGLDSANLSFDNLLRGFFPTSCSDLGSILWQAVEWVSCYLIWRNRNQCPS